MLRNPPLPSRSPPGNVHQYVCYHNSIAQIRFHLAKLKTLRADGLRDDMSPELQVEALLLAAYQAVEAAAARINVRIGKYQNIRRQLGANTGIFGDQTDDAWRAFQDLETRIRPKSIYGQSRNKSDLTEAHRWFKVIESCTEAVLQP